MKAALLWSAILGLAALVVLAVVFRSERARELLRLGRNMLYVWVALVVTMAAIEFWRRGGI